MIYRRVLLLCDLEGVNNVVGEPYMGLSKSTDQWKIAAEQAALELNVAADALFAAGVETVGLWDNHGGGENIDPAKLDPRIHLHKIDKTLPRLYFAEDMYDAVCFFGYHTMEGTLGGVLAHTMNSKANQFYRLNGTYIGEVDMDAYIAAEFGIPAIFFAAGDIACRQAKRVLPDITTVVTKREISRNEAEFRDNDSLFTDIRASITAATGKNIAPIRLNFPATFEKSFKRVEDAARYLERLTQNGISAEHPVDEILGRDAHTVVSTVKNMSEFITCI